MATGTPARGIPSLEWLELSDGNIMPRNMRLDTFEVNFERRIVEDERYTAYVGVPKNSTTQSSAIALSTLTAASSTNFKLVATIPGIDKGLLGSGVIEVGLLGGTSDILFDPSDTIVSKEISVTSSNNSDGFQIVHDNTDATLVYWSVFVRTTMGNDGIEEVPVTLDVIYNGNQRRKVKSLIATIDTTHISTVSSQFDTFIDAATLTNPVVYVADNNIERDNDTNSIDSLPMRRFVFSGEYKVDRISADRGEGRSASVTLSLTQEGTWTDE